MSMTLEKVTKYRQKTRTPHSRQIQLRPENVSLRSWTGVLGLDILVRGAMSAVNCDDDRNSAMR